MTFSPADLPGLTALADQFPTIESAVAEIAASTAALSLPKGLIHVVSDVHGEYRKLRHVINNASGGLRPLVESIFSTQLSPDQRRQLLNVLYYPKEWMALISPQLADPAWRRDWVRQTLRQQFAIVRELARNYRRNWLLHFFPPERAELFGDLINEPVIRAGPDYLNTAIDALASFGSDLAAVREASRLVRNLTASETIVAGDLGDRGPRIDRVIDYLQRQPNISLLWGNHDAEWMGACLGQEALIATVLRFSSRYRRLSQLEEGYGILMEPIENLARQVYGDDPCTHFKLVGSGLREDLLMARIQKAAAIMQLKLEGQTIRRHPEWNLEHRNLLHRIDLKAGTVEIDGKIHPLLDRNFPTLDPAGPYALSPAERVCMDRMRQSFIASARLWDHMLWVAQRGRMWCHRDNALIFHACVPVDRAGIPQPLNIDGAPRTGRDQMDAIDCFIRRCFRKGADHVGSDADWFWYLWGGPLSPLFGKDKLATFEGYFIADSAAREETKNPYFEMIHDPQFVRKIGHDFGMGDDVLIVNGHVPVKIEKGENPVKRGGNAVTIDGAFSEAYGDHGYTLILDPAGTLLAEHAHFDSVEEVLRSGKDMIPRITRIQSFDPPHRNADTETGQSIRQRVACLQKLILAYQEGQLCERPINRRQ